MRSWRRFGDLFCLPLNPAALDCPHEIKEPVSPRRAARGLRRAIRRETTQPDQQPSRGDPMTKGQTPSEEEKYLAYLMDTRRTCISPLLYRLYLLEARAGKPSLAGMTQSFFPPQNFGNLNEKPVLPLVAKDVTGVVYVLTNPHYGDTLKIGFTTKSTATRIRSLNAATGVLGKFEVVYEAQIAIKDAQKVERTAHLLLSGFRVSPKKEFLSAICGKLL